ncbi:hypothetical protein, partial [Salmonella sp. s54925]|uniref:hypothetical protein n=1 Tax=Salmonella sp. s54925 TaxID=3159674 RepID=UPI00397F9F73
PREEDEEDVESRLQREEGNDCDHETTNTTSKTNGASDIHESKLTEQTSNSDCSARNPVCERTSEAEPEDTSQVNVDNRDDDHEQTQINSTESSSSPEKIPVSARNGPSLS